MKINKNLLIWIFIILTILGLYFLSQFVLNDVTTQNQRITNANEYQNTLGNLNNSQSETNINITDFGECLVNKGALFYGSDSYPHCRKQKSLFNKYNVVPYVNCDENQGECMKQNIKLYPTWKIKGSKDLIGTQSLEYLSKITGCPLKQ